MYPDSNCIIKKNTGHEGISLNFFSFEPPTNRLRVCCASVFAFAFTMELQSKRQEYPDFGIFIRKSNPDCANGPYFKQKIMLYF